MRKPAVPPVNASCVPWRRSRLPGFMESNNRRLARVRELLKQEVAEILRQELQNEGSGSDGECRWGWRDLRSAIVFLGFVGTLASASAPVVLAEQAGLIRTCWPDGPPQVYSRTPIPDRRLNRNRAGFSPCWTNSNITPRPPSRRQPLMKPAPKPVEQILEALAPAKKVCIVGHIRPDGDCIGSQMGLALALENAGKEVTV